VIPVSVLIEPPDVLAVRRPWVSRRSIRRRRTATPPAWVEFNSPLAHNSPRPSDLGLRPFRPTGCGRRHAVSRGVRLSPLLRRRPPGLVLGASLVT